MGGYSSGSYYPWQDDRTRGAQQTWDQQGRQAIDDQTASRARASGASNEADAASSGYRGYNPNANVGDYRSSNLEGFSPSALQSWMASNPSRSLNLRGVSPATASRNTATPSNMSGYQPSGLQSWMSSMKMPGAYSAPAVQAGKNTFDPSALRAFNTDTLMNFDPSKAGSTFYQGAQGGFNKNLTERMRQLENSSAGAGRLNTGMFDADTGRVARDVSSDFENTLKEAALQFSGQKAGAIQAATGFNLDRARSIDQFGYETAEGNANREYGASGQNASNDLTARGQTIGAETSRYGLGLDAAGRNDQYGYERANALDKFAFDQGEGNANRETSVSRGNQDAELAARGQDISAYSAETGRSQMGLNAAELASQMGMQRATGLDAADWTRRSTMDRATQDQQRTGLDAALHREDAARGDYRSASDAASGFASGNLDRANTDRQTNDLEAWMQKMGVGKYAGGGAGNYGSATGGGGSGAQAKNPYAGTPWASYWRG